MNIFVTGYGVISSIGNNVDENFKSLLAEKSGIKKGTLPHTEKFLVGEVPLSNDELMNQFNLTTKGSRTALLGMVAAKEAFKGHDTDLPLKTGLISGTSVGGMDISENLYSDYLENGSCKFEDFQHHPSGTTTAQIATELGITGFQNTISTACSSAANAIMMGARMIRTGLLDRVIVGGTDSLTGFTINGFRSLMIFDDEWCRPFDESRKGLNLGEGAGFIVLESEKSLALSKKKPLAELTGWSNASDAFHQTASSPDGDGAVLSMASAIETSKLKPEDIDYVNAHGTATPNNDMSESKALIRIFDTIPAFSSTKAYTGHTLAASGGIEAVYSILAIQNNVVFPNLNHRNVIEETQLMPIKKVTEKQVNNVLSNSFGFGGNNSTVIFSRI